MGPLQIYLDGRMENSPFLLEGQAVAYSSSQFWKNGNVLKRYQEYECFIRTLEYFVEGSLEVKLPTIWTDEKQSREEAERRGRLEERRVEEKE